MTILGRAILLITFVFININFCYAELDLKAHKLLSGCGNGDVADINGDTIPDVVIVENHNIFINIGNGDGTFNNEILYTLGDDLDDFILADIDGDNNLDIVVVNDGSIYELFILYGKGDGTFENYIIFNTESTASPEEIVVADLNKDNIPDIILRHDGHTGYPDNKITIFKGIGSRVFSKSATYDVGNYHYGKSMFLIDINNDEVLDLIKFDSNSIFLLTGIADCIFNDPIELMTYLSINSMIVTDLNNDNIPDIATSSGSSNNISVYNGNGDGTFNNAVNYGTGNNLNTIVASDLNNDQFPDLITGDPNSDVVLIYMGSNNGSFHSVDNHDIESWFDSLSTYDMNNDGNLDLITYGLSGIFISIGNGDGTFKKAFDTTFGDESDNVKILDINGDTILDIVDTDNSIAVTGNGDGTISKNTLVYKTGLAPFSLAIADMNHDNVPDLITANNESDNISILLGNGDGIFQDSIEFEVGPEPCSVHILDIDGNHTQDIITSYDDTNYISILSGNGDGSAYETDTFDLGFEPRAITLNDLDADGISDLIVGGYFDNSGLINMYITGTNNTFELYASIKTEFISRSISISDLNGDGIKDIIATNIDFGSDYFEPDFIYVYLGTGDGKFRDPNPYSTGRGPYELAISDINNDLVPDLAIACANTGNVAVHIGYGDGTFKNPVFYNTGHWPRSVSIADIDGDEKLDLIVGNQDYDFGSVSILLGNNDGTFNNAVNYLVGDAPSALAISDLNNDGTPDIAVTNYDSDSISVIINKSFTTTNNSGGDTDNNVDENGGSSSGGGGCFISLL